MAFELSTNPPPDYWEHTPVGTYGLTDVGLLKTINAELIANGQEPRDPDELAVRLKNGGLFVLRAQPTIEFPAGELAGYLIADAKRDAGWLAVRHLFVEPQHRNRGLAGFMLGHFITDVQYERRNASSVAKYGTALQIGEQQYTLPGTHMITNQGLLASERDGLLRKMPGDWSGIVSHVNQSSVSHTIFRDGDKIAGAEEALLGQVYIEGSDRAYPHVVFAAIAVLNRDRVAPPPNPSA